MFIQNFLNWTIADDNTNLDINGYSMLRTDHPNNKRGGVCIYFNESLPPIRKNSKMQEFLVTILQFKTKNDFSHASTGLQFKILRS